MSLSGDQPQNCWTPSSKASIITWEHLDRTFRLTAFLLLHVCHGSQTWDSWVLFQHHLAFAEFVLPVLKHLQVMVTKENHLRPVGTSSRNVTVEQSKVSATKALWPCPIVQGFRQTRGEVAWVSRHFCSLFFDIFCVQNFRNGQEEIYKNERQLFWPNCWSSLLLDFFFSSVGLNSSETKWKQGFCNRCVRLMAAQEFTTAQRCRLGMLCIHRSFLIRPNVVFFLEWPKNFRVFFDHHAQMLITGENSIDQRLLLRPESFYKDYDIEVLHGATVTKLNTKDQMVHYTSQASRWVIFSIVIGNLV